MKPLKYKGYIAKLEYDDDDEIFYGSVINIKDTIEFKGRSVEELKQEFQNSIEDYIEFCQELGDEPDKPFSGKFHVRANPELHRSLFINAQLSNKSFNNYVVDVLDKHENKKHKSTFSKIHVYSVPEHSMETQLAFQIEKKASQKTPSMLRNLIFAYKPETNDTEQNIH